MKTFLKFTALALAAGFPAAAFAEFAGADVPAALNLEFALAAFVIVFTALTFLREYPRVVRPLPLTQHAFNLLALREVEARTRRSRAYGIRRGAEVAHL